MGRKKEKSKRAKLFFWQKPTKTAEEKAEEFAMAISKIMPLLKESFLPGKSNIETFGERIAKLYDFNDTLLTSQGSINENWGNMLPQINENSIDRSERAVAKPKEVLGELETVPTPINCEQLEEKIALLKDKESLVNQRYVKAQLDGYIQCLYNRKRYKEHYEFFNQFPNTTDDNIDILLKKYKLVLQKSDLFIPQLPKEAVDVMKEYTRITVEISGKEPVFYIIGEEDDFQKKEKKLDPILLVQSPFGFFWQILGAWDKEMILLTEL